MDNCATLSMDQLYQDLKDNVFEIYYQAQFNNQAQLIGVEALLRHNNPIMKNIPIINLIKEFEKNNFIIPLGKWIFEKSCKQLNKWSKNPKTSNIPISINISPKQIYDDNFIVDFLTIIKETNVSTHLLKFELTENILILDIQKISERIHLLKNYNIKFSLDDFGTGYASFECIKNINFDEIKIDRTFVYDLLENQKSIEIVKAMVALANNLNIAIIAEGVETTSQKRVLEQYSCHNYQGYLFGKPMRIQDLERTYSLI